VFILHARGAEASSAVAAAAALAAACEPAAPGGDEARPFTVVSSMARTRLDASRRRSADLKAVAFASRHPLADALRPALSAALDALFAVPRSDTLAAVHAAVAALPLPPLRLPARRARAVLRAALPLDCAAANFLYAPPLAALMARCNGRHGGSRQQRAGQAAAAAAAGDAAPAPLLSEADWFYVANVKLELGGFLPPVPLAVRLPLFLEPALFHLAPLTALVRRFGAGVVDIFHAVLRERRILFIGSRGTPAADVCSAVLACAHLVCPPLPAEPLARRLFRHVLLALVHAHSA
jgi:hypothetical protein